MGNAMRSRLSSKSIVPDFDPGWLSDHRALADSQFADWGLKRIVRDLLAIPARLRFRQSQLYRIDLLAAHPYSQELRICLEKYCSTTFGE